MADDARQIVTQFYKLSGSTGSHAITRQEQLRVRHALIEVTLDSDSATRLDLNAIGFTSPIVIAVAVMAVDGSATGNWEAYNNRSAEVAANGFNVEWDDAASGSPHSIAINTVGSNMQGELARVFIWYLDREP